MFGAKGGKKNREMKVKSQMQITDSGAQQATPKTLWRYNAVWNDHYSKIIYAYEITNTVTTDAENEIKNSTHEILIKRHGS